VNKSLPRVTVYQFHETSSSVKISQNQHQQKFQINFVPVNIVPKLSADSVKGVVNTLQSTKLTTRRFNLFTRLNEEETEEEEPRKSDGLDSSKREIELLFFGCFGLRRYNVTPLFRTCIRK
jgi:hypothetical protein